ncbi:MAG: hypothetical protein KHZ72_01725 [Lachnospiraceae bacterium]|nr:hypothetical protein [Lachnospiraceae bacterium]
MNVRLPVILLSRDSYWMGSSLKISDFEQVSLLTDFYQNTWFFATNIQAEQHASGSVA